MKDNKELLLHNTDDDFDEFEKALAVIAEEAYEEYVKEGKKSRPIYELLNEDNDDKENDMTEKERLIKIFIKKNSAERKEKIREKEQAYIVYKTIPLNYRLWAFELTKQICSEDHQDHEFIDYIIEYMSRHSYKAVLFSFISPREFGSGCSDFDVQLVKLCQKLYMKESERFEKIFDLVEKKAENYNTIDSDEKKSLLDAYKKALKEYCYIVEHIGIPLTPTEDEMKKMAQWCKDNSET